MCLQLIVFHAPTQLISSTRLFLAFYRLYFLFTVIDSYVTKIISLSLTIETESPRQPLKLKIIQENKTTICLSSEDDLFSSPHQMFPDPRWWHSFYAPVLGDTEAGGVGAHVVRRWAPSLWLWSRWTHVKILIFCKAVPVPGHHSWSIQNLFMKLHMRVYLKDIRVTPLAMFGVTVVCPWR